MYKSEAVRCFIVLVETVAPVTAIFLMQIHEQRLKAEGCYSDEEIKNALQQVQVYKTLNQERPGFFDTAINTG